MTDELEVVMGERDAALLDAERWRAAAKLASERLSAVGAVLSDYSDDPGTNLAAAVCGRIRAALAMPSEVRLVSERGPEIVWEGGIPRKVGVTIDRPGTAEYGRRLASDREDLIAGAVDPAELVVPLHPDDAGRMGS